MKQILASFLALALLLTACAANPAAASAWEDCYGLGMRYMNSGNYEEAIIAFNSAIEIDQKQPEVYVVLSDAYEKAGKTEAAEKIISEAQELFGNDTLNELFDEYSSGKLQADYAAAADDTMNESILPFPIKGGFEGVASFSSEHPILQAVREWINGFFDDLERQVIG